MTTTTALTEVHLINVPLENTYNHTLYFNSRGDQWTYFSGLFRDVASAYNCTYQRKDKIIRYPNHYDLIKGYNYVVFINEVELDNGTSQQFRTFAFINKMEYISDKRTDIYIETDVMQTYFKQYQVKECFIEREHVKDDTIGLHTLEEGLEKGDYVIAHEYPVPELKETRVVIGTTINPETLGNSIGGTYGGIYSGVKYFSYGDKSTITSKLQNIADNKDDAAITSLFMAPKFLLDSDGEGAVPQTFYAKTMETQAFKVWKEFNGYTPKNNKLLCYPYNYLLADTRSGSPVIYKFEHFENNRDSAGLQEIKFSIQGVITPGCSIMCYPLGYKNMSPNYNEGLPMAKYPQCNWATDQYTNWLTQNGVNIRNSYISSGANFLGSIVGAGVGGFMTAGPVGAAVGTIGAGLMSGVNAFTEVTNTMNEVTKAEMIPPQAGGNMACGDVLSANGTLTLTLIQMMIKKEYAQMIDNYFNMYGYKVNMVKVPNENHRKEYWFTKCIHANITGDIPNEDMNIIKSCYNKGITFWKNVSNMRNYNVNNPIV